MKIKANDYLDISKELDTQIKEVYAALGHFLNAEFNTAYNSIQGKAELEYPYHNLGKSFLFFIKAVFTFDPDDINRTVEQIDHSINVASKIRDSERKAMYVRLTDAVRIRSHQPEEKIPEDMQRLIAHCELIVAELTLLRAVLLISSDSQEGWILMLRQSLHIYRSYSFYFHARTGPFMEDAQFKSGVLLGNGVFNLMFPLMPPRISQVFAFFGYKGNTKLGLEQLKESAFMDGCIRAPLCGLVILLYHLIIACTIPTSERVKDDRREQEADWFKLCDKILSESSSLYPNSPIYKYFHGRFLFIQRRIRDAINVFENVMEMEIEWPHLKHAGYWEVCLCSLYTLDWERGYKYSKVMAKENRWSKAFYTYFEAIFLWSLDETKIDEVKELLKDIPHLMKRVAGRSIPIEKFALHRANMVIHENRLPFHPALEIALVWDGIQMIEPVDRETIEKMMMESLPKMNDSEMKGQILLTLATLKRLNGNNDEAMKYADGALVLKVPNDSYCLPLANLELSHVFLIKGELEKAENHYNESVGYKHPYLVKKFLEIRQARVKIEIEEAKQGKESSDPQFHRR